MKRNRILFGILAVVLIPACTSLPSGVSPITGFNVDRYLGKWFEIARLDHSFERGLDNVTATYELNADGSIKVVNRGTSIETDVVKTAIGKAYFVEDKTVGHLKVSFFGPFYSSYVIFEIDEKNYDYAYIAGYNHSYLWLLSRKPDVDYAVFKRFMNKARELGFDTSNMIKVDHDVIL